MSANSILSLKSVCEDYNIADDVVRIIMEYVKSHTFKHKINIQFLNGFNTMLDGIPEPCFTSECEELWWKSDTFYGVMADTDEMPGFELHLDADDRDHGWIVDWYEVFEHVREPVFRIPKLADGRVHVSTITDFMETGGEISEWIFNQ
jgi:hypothetical protein